MKISPAIIFCLLLLSGCSSPGSTRWHALRMNEIENYYVDGKISAFEYLYLKNQVDYARATRLGDVPIIIESDPQNSPEVNNFLAELMAD